MNIIISEISDFEELEVLKNSWESWQNHPNNDFEHYKLVCQLRKDSVSPNVIIAEHNGVMCAMLIGRVENTWFSPAIGYFKPMRFRTRSLAVLYQGLIGNFDEEISRSLVLHIWSILKTGKVDIVDFHNLPEHSQLRKVLAVAIPKRFFENASVAQAHWVMALGDKPGFLLKNLRSKHRSWINSRLKKLESDYSGKVTWKWLNNFDNISNITAQLEVVAAKTYQRGLGAGFVDDEEHRQRYRLFADRGQLRIQVVEVEDEVKAFWIGTVYKGIFHSAATGYDPDMRIYELGTLMFVSMTDELVKEGVFKIDFGLGDASYKERFGDNSWVESQVRVFAPNFKGTLLRTTQASFNRVDNALRKLLKDAGVLDRVKTHIRRMAQKRSK